MSSAIADHLVHHVNDTIFGTESGNDGSEDWAVFTETAEILYRESFYQQFADIGNVIVLLIVGHPYPRVPTNLGQPHEFLSIATKPLVQLQCRVTQTAVMGYPG